MERPKIEDFDSKDDYDEAQNKYIDHLEDFIDRIMPRDSPTPPHSN